MIAASRCSICAAASANFPVREDPSVPGGHRFCAKATSADQVYCALHQSIAITGPKSRTGKDLHRQAYSETSVQAFVKPSRLSLLYARHGSGGPLIP